MIASVDVSDNAVDAVESRTAWTTPSRYLYPALDQSVTDSGAHESHKRKRTEWIKGITVQPSSTAYRQHGTFTAHYPSNDRIYHANNEVNASYGLCMEPARVSNYTHNNCS
jgi:hypothetical protein